MCKKKFDAHTFKKKPTMGDNPHPHSPPPVKNPGYTTELCAMLYIAYSNTHVY